jgi:adenylate kinase
MPMNTVFVAGIHAVGKSTVCKAVSDKFGVSHYTASQIIKEEKSSAILANSKLVADVAENQWLLIQGVLKRLNEGHFLLDGHFTMRRKSDGEIETIHVDVFRDLRIGGVVLFTDHPEEIVKRMHARDGVLHSVEMFHAHQVAEVTHAKYVAEILNLPIVILEAFDLKGLVSVMTNWGYV